MLEYLSGGQLFERIILNETDFSEEDVLRIVRQICKGVEYLAFHNVVHLDLKPENIVCVDEHVGISASFAHKKGLERRHRQMFLVYFNKV